MDDELRQAIDDFNAGLQDAALENKKAIAKARAEQQKRSKGTGRWPVVSRLSLACDPSQVNEYNERNKKLGLAGVMYRPNGDCEISDEGAYKRLRRYEGFRDRDSYTE